VKRTEETTRKSEEFSHVETRTPRKSLKVTGPGSDDSKGEVLPVEVCMKNGRMAAESASANYLDLLDRGAQCPDGSAAVERSVGPDFSLIPTCLLGIRRKNSRERAIRSRKHVHRRKKNLGAQSKGCIRNR